MPESIEVLFSPLSMLALVGPPTISRQDNSAGFLGGEGDRPV